MTWRIRLNNKLVKLDTNFKSPSIHRTPLYRAKAAYSNMLARCKNANGKNPAYLNVKLKMTLDEWLCWSIPKYANFQKMFPGKSPNVSRFKDKGHYEIGNIAIVPQTVNLDIRYMPGQAKNGKKRCSTCKQTKPLLEFTKNKHTRDGFAHQCKACRKIQMKKWISKPGIDEKINKRGKEKRMLKN